MAYQLPYQHRKLRRRWRYGQEPRTQEYCPVCRYRMPAPDSWHESELFCQKCETLLHWVENYRGGWWVEAGVYS